MVLPNGLLLANEMAERRLGARKGSAAVPAWPAVMTALVLSAVPVTLMTAGVAEREPNNPCCSFVRPAVKYRTFVGPAWPPLPNLRAHKSFSWKGWPLPTLREAMNCPVVGLKALIL